MAKRARILPIAGAVAHTDMVGDVQRLQYLEAMGLGAWASRYRLPNALPTPACEWETPPAEAPTNHGVHLQALLDDAVRAPSTPPSKETSSGATPSRDTGKPASSVSARALLLGDAPTESSSRSMPEDAAESAASTAEVGEAGPQAALRYDLQVAALEGRWLLLVPEATAPDRTALELLGNLLRVAGIVVDAALEFRSFQWPLVDNAPVTTAPLDDARDGLRAYLAGQARRGWRPERLLVFGQDTTLNAVLALEEAHSETLGLPCWTLPSLATLKSSAAAKRALWPQLAVWRDAWAGHDDAS
ncbi:hypothetical protein [Chromohalobacter nigrandesensis]|uniref:hypothetical protein n=1 Tax=Chromohalobacter nigrandesensis TaxID=119863 RepID=UPI001FF200CF|nr:hypothetical protein [Chromohalobacter nigrandesensis]MCK0745545.1 hypothetical protein [Chromohalobacter nigrandesensis]